MVFDTDGFILPCNSMVGVKIGRIDKDFIDGPGLMTLLSQEEIRDGYREMLRYPSSECSDCGYNDYCRGGCIVNWMVLDPDICHKF
ncbi:SPASM domain-containing protein [Candidatus Saccharibacteria bacterium]|nr:SPASM domain-containing protein [Candidatus Saccharibacteria bacterium]